VTPLPANDSAEPFTIEQALAMAADLRRQIAAVERAQARFGPAVQALAAETADALSMPHEVTRD